MKSLYGWMRLVVCVLLSFSLVYSYDTGHHADLTRNVLQLLGFNPASIDVAVVCNWQIDYYAYTEVNEEYPLNGLHFDNMYNLRNVSNYFNTLATNTKNAIQAAVVQKDILAFIGLIGASSHPVQDFYTHSSWSDMHQFSCNCYRDDTWFSALASVDGYVPDLLPQLQSVISYSWGTEGCGAYLHDCTPGLIEHGDYCSGINKDSYVRPKFESSYAHAFAGTYEWIYNILLWADEASGIINNSSSSSSQGSLPGISAFVQNAKAYTPSSSDLSDLIKDVESSIDISYATAEPRALEQFTDGLQSGHWKGAGSGSYSRFASSVLEFIVRSSKYSDLFTVQKIWQNITSPNPYYLQPGVSETNPPVYDFFVAYSEIPENLRNFTKIKLRTTNVTVPDKLFNTPSPYALITIDGQEFEECVQQNEYSFGPHWTAIRYIRANTTFVDVKYALWNDQFPSDDEQYTLNNGPDGALYFRMNVYTQQLIGFNGTVLNGTYNSFNNRANVTYNGVTISFYMDQVQYGNCNVQVWPTLICPDEAYGQYLLHPICGEDVTKTSFAVTINSWLLSFIEWFREIKY